MTEQEMKDALLDAMASMGVPFTDVEKWAEIQRWLRGDPPPLRRVVEEDPTPDEW